MRDASDFPADVGPERGAEWAPRLHWRAATPLGDALGRPTGPAALAVPAYANEGRWVAACPDCGSAQLACMTDQRFMCSECANVAVDGLWRPVIWPPNTTDLGAELDKRPYPTTQNWVPGESLADLRAEAAAHADDAPSPPDWSGHTHTWPKTLQGPTVACEECGLILPTDIIRADREGGA